ncbi:hypothetical protein [Olleya sp. YS]|uniref:hypothetical protein n=1 Tax=Olleya sp. YS TaxID=3028318 RepID=UPI0024345417|nr:hypothetical protein [Olleya sp. YS]WGD35631.1 hypothetical protein Ollyesu_04290 [Olleya sp. YS]
MKYLKNRRIIVLMLLIAVLAINFSSCDKFIKNEKSEITKNEETIEDINDSKNEAKLLLMLSKDNQDAITLSQILKDKLEKDSIAELAKTIEDTHIYVAKTYNDVASKALISIPNYSELSEKQTIENDNVKIASQLKSKIDSQLFLLEQLSKTTKNKEFKKLVNTTNSKLKSSLNKTKNIINNLNTNS